MDQAHSFLKAETRKELFIALTTLLEDLGSKEDQHLTDTAARMLRSWEELLAGTFQNPAAVLKEGFAEKHDQMIFVRDIEFISLCAHHFLPFYGVAHFAYLPNERVVGLSKIPRMIDILSRRLQLQERLTQQIVDIFQSSMKPHGCAVMVEAHHMCMAIRGVRKQKARMVTTALTGLFLERPHVKEEFLLTVRNGG